MTPDGRTLRFRGQSIEIPKRGFARPEPFTISEADPFYLPDVPASEWAWDAESDEWIPNPGPLAQAGIAPPSALTVFMMKAVRRAHLMAQDAFFRRHPVDTWAVFHELSYLDLHLVLRMLEERRVPRDITNGHINLGALLVELEGQCWSGGPIGAPDISNISAYETALLTRHAQYRKLKTSAEMEKCALATAAGRVLEAASSAQRSPEEHQAHALMMRVTAHVEIQNVRGAANEVPAGYWGPDPNRPGGQQFSEDGLFYWDEQVWRSTCRSEDGRSFWAGDGWRPVPSQAIPVGGTTSAGPDGRARVALDASMAEGFENREAADQSGAAVGHWQVRAELWGFLNALLAFDEQAWSLILTAHEQVPESRRGLAEAAARAHAEDEARLDENSIVEAAARVADGFAAKAGWDQVRRTKARTIAMNAARAVALRELLDPDAFEVLYAPVSQEAPLDQLAKMRYLWSPDKRWYRFDEGWKLAVSPEGCHRWSGTGWVTHATDPVDLSPVTRFIERLHALSSEQWLEIVVTESHVHDALIAADTVETPLGAKELVNTAFSITVEACEDEFLTAASDALQLRGVSPETAAEVAGVLAGNAAIALALADRLEAPHVRELYGPFEKHVGYASVLEPRIEEPNSSGSWGYVGPHAAALERFFSGIGQLSREDFETLKHPLEHGPWRLSILSDSIVGALDPVEYERKTLTWYEDAFAPAARALAVDSIRVDYLEPFDQAMRLAGDIAASIVAKISPSPLAEDAVRLAAGGLVVRDKMQSAAFAMLYGPFWNKIPPLDPWGPDVAAKRYGPNGAQVAEFLSGLGSLSVDEWRELARSWRPSVGLIDDMGEALRELEVMQEEVRIAIAHQVAVARSAAMTDASWVAWNRKPGAGQAAFFEELAVGTSHSLRLRGDPTRRAAAALVVREWLPADAFSLVYAPFRAVIPI